MKQLDQISDIVKLSARFILEVNELSKLGFYNIHIHSESFIAPVLNSIFDLNLVNANRERRKSFPAIDLIDTENKVAVQVTSTTTLSKLKSTIEKFIKFDLHKEFDSLLIFLLSDNFGTTVNIPTEFLEGLPFKFSPDKHIISISSLNSLIESSTTESIDFVHRVYQHNFSDSQIERRRVEYEEGYLVKALLHEDLG